ncbi:MAG: hypothetical protein ACRD19_08875 [Terriglobia bacterium]
MSSENLGPDKGREAKHGPSRASVILLAVVLAAMAALAVSFYPPRVHLTPAPLLAYPRGCVMLKSHFVPTDVTEVPFVPVNALPAQAKSRVLLHLNMTSCSCGCAQSVVVCRLKNPQCKISPQLMKQELENAGRRD